jgi:multidrug efflux pump subunit AcrA (membrane-fusion protein)
MIRWKPVLFIATAVAAVAIVVFATVLGAPEPTFPTTDVRSAEFRARVTAEGNLSAVRSTPLTAPVNPQVPFVLAWMVEDGTLVEEGAVVARFDASQLEKDREDGLSDQRISDHRILSAETDREVDVGKLDVDAEVADEELEIAREFQSTDSLIYSKIEITESQIDTELAEVRADHATRSKTIEDELSRAEIELLSIERRKADIKIEQAEQGLAALEIRAPHGGIVMIERDWRGNPVRVGDTIWPGRPLVSIPDLTKMQAEVFVLEADAGDLEPGQTATVWLESAPDLEHPAILKSVDPMAGRRNRRVPVQYFRTVLELETTVEELMKPGSRVRAEIIIADIDRCLTVPRQAVSSLDGEPVVYRWQRREFVPVPVELGPAALGRVVVTSGLEDGDRIALGDPKVVDEDDGSDADSRSAPPIPGGGS